jgi:hypothetical protein
MKPTHILTARSKSGRRLDCVTGSPVTSISVYGLTDLGRRLAAAARDPEIGVSVRRLPATRAPKETNPRKRKASNGT